VPLYMFSCDFPMCPQDDFEVMKPMRDAASPEQCPACGSSASRVFTAPQVKTSNTFLAGRPMGGGQFSDKTRDHMLRMAREAGVSTDGKAYDGRIARFPGDPEAWVQSPDDVKRVLEKRGWSAEGDINVKGEQKAPRADIPLANDLVAEKVELVLEERLGEDFTTASGPVVERAVEDVLNQYAQPAHLLGGDVSWTPQKLPSAGG
jgi:putative FmdB family regulatory protein